MGVIFSFYSLNNEHLNIPFKTILWVILSIPAMLMMSGFFRGVSLSGELLHPTGEFAARFMIIAMIATPLQILFQNRGWSMTIPRWLIRYRRAFGVAAFAYALLHTLLYMVDVGDLAGILAEVAELGIWTGWIAFFIFVPLAITSNNKSQRLLKAGWKKLQRWVYPAAVLTLVHWIFVHNNLGPALVHFLPLTALELYRIYTIYLTKKEATS